MWKTVHIWTRFRNSQTNKNRRNTPRKWHDQIRSRNSVAVSVLLHSTRIIYLSAALSCAHTNKSREYTFRASGSAWSALEYRERLTQIRLVVAIKYREHQRFGIPVAAVRSSVYHYYPKIIFNALTHTHIHSLEQYHRPCLTITNIFIISILLQYWSLFSDVHQIVVQHI